MFLGRRIPREETRRRRLLVHIPARYVVRPSRAERVLPWILIPCGTFLLGVCLTEAGQVYDPFYPYVVLAFAGLTALGVLWALEVRKVRLEVDGERLTYRRRRRPEVEFFFSDVAFVQARRGRETVVLWDERRQVLCRLKVTMDGLDTLLADLRSREAVFLQRPPQGRDLPPPPLGPGPRREALELDLPARVPEGCCLRHSGALIWILALSGLLLAALDLACLLDGAWPEALCFLPFPLGTLAALVLVRRERIEFLGSRFLWRPLWGPVREIPLSHVAAARLRTHSTGIGPISTVQLLDREGEVLLRPGAGMVGTRLLLADLIDRGIPFTY